MNSSYHVKMTVLALASLAGLTAFAAAPKGGLPSGCDADVMSAAYWQIWNAGEQARIDADIERNRKADCEVAVDAPAGTEVTVEQLTHDFRFGAHIFNFNQLGKTEWNDAYKASYGQGGIFNQATVAFYWVNYEPVPGKLRAHGDYGDTERYWNALSIEEAMHEANWRRPAPGPVVDFLKTKDVAIHGHILVWGSAKPYWIYDWYCPESEKRAFDALGIPRHSTFLKRARAGAEGNFGFAKQWKDAWWRVYKTKSEADIEKLAPVFTANMRRLFRKRIFDVAKDFGDVVDSWDVVNESSSDWARRYRKSRTGRGVWFSEYGLMPGDYPLHALLDAKEAMAPSARLAINDWNVCPDFLAQVKDLQNEGARIDLVGCQMHIFDTNECMRLAKGETKDSWNGVWVSSPAKIRERLDTMAKTGKPLHVSEVTISATGTNAVDRQIQAILTRNIYRAWFSHPATMGITWWNTVDGGGVYGEPLVSGLFTRDLKKKPAYLALDELINREWKTKTVVKVGEGRKVSFRGFCGKYVLSWKGADGRPASRTVYVTPQERKSGGEAARCDIIKSQPTEGKKMNKTCILETSLGTITLELDEAKAPITVANFVNYAKAGHYDGTVFHRVIDGFMIQGGGFTSDMTQKATQAPIRNEAANGLKNLRGTIAMARTAVVDSATSQFFINLKDNGFLDYTAPNPRQFGYAVFGRVTAGLDVVDKIAKVRTGTVGYYQDVPVEPVVIKSVKVAE